MTKFYGLPLMMTIRNPTTVTKLHLMTNKLMRIVQMPLRWCATLPTIYAIFHTESQYTNLHHKF